MKLIAAWEHNGSVEKWTLDAEVSGEKVSVFYRGNKIHEFLIDPSIQLYEQMIKESGVVVGELKNERFYNRHPQQRPYPIAA